MLEVLEKNRDDYGFEIVPEVQDKIAQAENLHQLIPEACVEDLKYIDVTGKFYCRVKRVLDVVCSALGLLVLLIPIVVVMVLVYVDDPGSVFFSQYRIGRNGKRFKMLKFRTMKMDTPKYMATGEIDDPELYITRVGRILRKLSLDEVPQLINVLKGDMSLVGPRPLITDEYEIHAMRMRFGVYNIHPGVTGLAQINGRDLIDAERKLHWDVQYLENFGLWQDLKILLATAPKILNREGVAEGGNKEK